MGVVAEVERYYRAADAFVLPSAVEGMSNALLEAMAQGLPCIGTRISGSEELIEHGVNGLLVPRDDPSALSAALREILNDATLRRKLGRAARQTVEKSYTIESVAQCYLKLYEELPAARGERHVWRSGPRR